MRRAGEAEQRLVNRRASAFRAEEKGESFSSGFSCARREPPPPFSPRFARPRNLFLRPCIRREASGRPRLSASFERLSRCSAAPRSAASARRDASSAARELRLRRSSRTAANSWKKSNRKKKNTSLPPLRSPSPRLGRQLVHPAPREEPLERAPLFLPRSMPPARTSRRRIADSSPPPAADPSDAWVNGEATRSGVPRSRRTEPSPAASASVSSASSDSRCFASARARRCTSCHGSRLAAATAGHSRCSPSMSLI